MKRGLIAIYFVLCVLALSFVSAYATPVPGFTVNPTSSSVNINVQDRIVYQGAYYSLNGGAWQPLTLSGQLWTNGWMNSRGTGSVPLPSGFSGTVYVIAYSCSLISNQWDCHTNQWQLHQVSVTAGTVNTNTVPTSSGGSTNTGANTGTGTNTGSSLTKCPAGSAPSTQLQGMQSSDSRVNYLKNLLADILGSQRSVDNCYTGGRWQYAQQYYYMVRDQFSSNVQNAFETAFNTILVRASTGVYTTVTHPITSDQVIRNLVAAVSTEVNGGNAFANTMEPNKNPATLQWWNPTGTFNPSPAHLIVMPGQNKVPTGPMLANAYKTGTSKHDLVRYIAQFPMTDLGLGPGIKAAYAAGDISTVNPSALSRGERELVLGLMKSAGVEHLYYNAEYKRYSATSSATYLQNVVVSGWITPLIYWDPRFHCDENKAVEYVLGAIDGANPSSNLAYYQSQATQFIQNVYGNWDPTLHDMMNKIGACNIPTTGTTSTGSTGSTSCAVANTIFTPQSTGASAPIGKVWYKGKLDSGFMTVANSVIDGKDYINAIYQLPPSTGLSGGLFASTAAWEIEEFSNCKFVPRGSVVFTYDANTQRVSNRLDVLRTETSLPVDTYSSNGDVCVGGNTNCPNGPIVTYKGQEIANMFPDTLSIQQRKSIDFNLRAGQPPDKVTYDDGSPITDPDEKQGMIDWLNFRLQQQGLSPTQHGTWGGSATITLPKVYDMNLLAIFITSFYRDNIGGTLPSTSAVPSCTDNDNDGYGQGCSAGADCNDNNRNVNPGATEICSTSYDDNCNGVANEGCSASTSTGPTGSTGGTGGSTGGTSGGTSGSGGLNLN